MDSSESKKFELQKLIGDDGNNITTLREKTGPLKKLDVKLATSKAAGNALIMIESEKIKSQANIALTGLKLAEATIRSAMVGNAMPQIGALTTRVNQATTAVDQALTNGNAAEVFTHLSNRNENINLVKSLQVDGKITNEEGEIIVNFAQHDAAEDIRASRLRMKSAKEAVAGLHEFALKGISDSRNS